jgi:hypothetical protein
MVLASRAEINIKMCSHKEVTRPPEKFTIKSVHAELYLGYIVNKCFYLLYTLFIA